jgi:hypothetical protein
MTHDSAVPAPLQTGGPAADSTAPTPYIGGQDDRLSTYNDFIDQDRGEGNRSPALSEGSHFTSVSQRGVNPNWRPPPGQGPGYGPAGQFAPYGGNRRRQEDMVLNANPDFAIPGMGAARGRGGAPRGGMRPPRPPMPPGPPGFGGQNAGLGPGGMPQPGMGRYPGPNAI